MRRKSGKYLNHAGKSEMTFFAAGAAPYRLQPAGDFPNMSYVARQDRPVEKSARYAEAAAEIAAVLEGEPDRVARMATVATTGPSPLGCNSPPAVAR